MLTLFSHIYRLIWVVRKRLYDDGLLKTRRLPCPVICVGNLTTGGTGKTPAVIAITKILKGGNGGFRVAILSRGYKRKSKDPVLVVSDGTSLLASPEESGDEPYLMASTLMNVPVVVGADRYKSGIHAAKHNGANILILDDGYQHIQLQRDINILLMDASNPYGNGHLLPKGILREPLHGVSRADCVIITRADEGDGCHIGRLVRKYNPKAPVFYASYKASDVTDREGHSSGVDSVKGKKVLIFSGIANPESFRKSIEHIGGKIVGQLSYPDHYWYKMDDLQTIMNDASAVSAEAVVTTAKDAVRLHGLDLYDETGVRMKILVLHVEMIIDHGFTMWLQKRLAVVNRGLINVDDDRYHICG